MESIEGDYYNVTGFPVNRFCLTIVSLCKEGKLWTAIVHDCLQISNPNKNLKIVEIWLQVVSNWVLFSSHYIRMKKMELVEALFAIARSDAKDSIFILDSLISFDKDHPYKTSPQRHEDRNLTKILVDFGGWSVRNNSRSQFKEHFVSEAESLLHILSSTGYVKRTRTIQE